jgi:hypothetical protein
VSLFLIYFLVCVPPFEAFVISLFFFLFSCFYYVSLFEVFVPSVFCVVLNFCVCACVYVLNFVCVELWKKGQE